MYTQLCPHSASSPCHSILLRRKPNSLEPNLTIKFRKFRSRDEHRQTLPAAQTPLPDSTVSLKYVPLGRGPACWAGDWESLWEHWLSALHCSQMPMHRQSLAPLLEPMSPYKSSNLGDPCTRNKQKYKPRTIHYMLV